MSLPRIISQVVFLGAQILGRAFVEAYKQAAANAAKNAATNAASRSADAITRTTGMTIEEAAQILNVKREANLEEVMKKYEHLFKSNEPSTGGSFYIQSKVFRARERLEMEFKERGIPLEEAAEAKPPQPTPPSQ
ncbi:hypothetical protein SmJEL517_g03248 [Synchytrium microbalum]|uniref:Mitochondrial import inner membrane translocase subunit TIM16 n=1 Tax=Synchytrium microbalum TaxID=1806994 RepID=A0A507C4I1_9FUNG|nr:uncharacterized protein SmJEL517_g03248 [Synchytrium microbalum]TPX34009.1 hypothetical protein SmJEL517_g03248 [Synchytrium microbalum]